MTALLAASLVQAAGPVVASLVTAAGQLGFVLVGAVLALTTLRRKSPRYGHRAARAGVVALAVSTAVEVLILVTGPGGVGAGDTGAALCRCGLIVGVALLLPDLAPAAPSTSRPEWAGPVSGLLLVGLAVVVAVPDSTPLNAPGVVRVALLVAYLLAASVWSAGVLAIAETLAGDDPGVARRNLAAVAGSRRLLLASVVVIVATGVGARLLLPNPVAANTWRGTVVQLAATGLFVVTALVVHRIAARMTFRLVFVDQLRTQPKALAGGAGALRVSLLVVEAVFITIAFVAAAATSVATLTG